MIDDEYKKASQAAIKSMEALAIAMTPVQQKMFSIAKAMICLSNMLVEYSRTNRKKARFMQKRKYTRQEKKLRKVFFALQLQLQLSQISMIQQQPVAKNYSPDVLVKVNVGGVSKIHFLNSENILQKFL